MRLKNHNSCIQLVKGLSQCDLNVRGMNLRVLLGNSKLGKKILKSTWREVISLTEESSSGLTVDEVLRLKATVTMVSYLDVELNFPGMIKRLSFGLLITY